MFEMAQLTQGVLTRDRERAAEHGDERGAARARSQMVALAELPAQFVIERTQMAVEPSRDPGCELQVFDERFRPRRIIAKVARRRIGRQAVSWTPGQLLDPVQAEAMIVALRYAVTDAERD